MKSKVVEACNFFNKYRKTESEIMSIIEKYKPGLTDTDEFMDSISPKICYGGYSDMNEFWRDIELLETGKHLEISQV
jgi:hypothetical protein